MRGANAPFSIKFHIRDIPKASKGENYGVRGKTYYLTLNPICVFISKDVKIAMFGITSKKKHKLCTTHANSAHSSLPLHL